MNSKKVNWMFLITIMVELVITFFLGLFHKYISIGIVQNLILSEMILVVPAFLFLIVTRTGWKDVLVFRRLKISTVLMIILFTYLSMPLVTTLNAFTMLFSDNVVQEMSGDILQLPFLVMLFLMGVFGPLCEELVFRGIVHSGYRKSGTALQAMLFSAILFGLMHMNINQAVYAFAIGIMLAALKEATGSMWASVIYHVIFNSNTVVMLYVTSKWFPALEDASSEKLSTDVLIATISVSLIVAVITMSIGACILVWIAKNEGNEGCFVRLLKERKQGKGKMITLPLLISIVVCLAFMVMQIVLL